jgi:CMP-N-acetylneuraminic acid synthetase
MTLAVVIPVRAGSKGVPGKNLARVGGRPLLDWTVEAALAARCVDRVLVSTDSAAVRAHVRATWPGRVALPARSPATASDTATTESVLVDVLGTPEAAGADEIGLVQATSPLLRAEDLDGAYALLHSGFDSVLSVVRQRRFRWSEGPDGAHADYDPAASSSRATSSRTGRSTSRAGPRWPAPACGSAGGSGCGRWPRRATRRSTSPPTW